MSEADVGARINHGFDLRGTRASRGVENGSQSLPGRVDAAARGHWSP